MRNPKNTIAIAAGGTGGHLFPAQALAEELKRRGYDIVLLTDSRTQKFDELFPSADVHRISAATISPGNIGKALSEVVTIMRGVAQAWAVLGRAKPLAMVGFGGYPSLPPVVAALLRGIPLAIHVPDAVLGRVNRAVSPYVDVIAAAVGNPKYLHEEDRERVIVTGNPVRDAVQKAAGTPYQRLPRDGRICLLVFGGSQGAKVMADVVPQALARLDIEWRERLHVVQQANKNDVTRVEIAYDHAGISARVSDFFTDLPEQMALAHLVIARSGASTVSELSTIGRPAFLVPLPSATDDHQKYNALDLEKAGAADMILQPDFTPVHLADRLDALLDAPDRLVAMAERARAQGKTDAARLLADAVETLGRANRSGRRAAIVRRVFQRRRAA